MNKKFGYEQLQVKSIDIIKKKWFLLSCIIVIGFLIRIFQIDWQIPLTFDALYYFGYATEVNYLGRLPEDWTPSNNGWPLLLSGIFSIVPSNDVFVFMQLQKVVSVILSVITIIPVYYLCKRFVVSRIALVGAAIFSFEPRLIQNSILGITEPLFILLTTLSIIPFLSTNKKIMFTSFVFAAFATIVRAEGLFLLLSITILFFIRFRKNSRDLVKYPIFIGLAILIITPIAIYRMDTIGSDGLIFRISNSATDTIERVSQNEGNGIIYFITTFELFLKFLGWVLIPIFIFFVPIGIIFIFKDIQFSKIVIIIPGFLMAASTLYGYSIQVLDHRFLYVLFPLFCVLSVISIDHYKKKMDKKIILLIIVLGILITSSLFLNLKKTDFQHERESYEIAKKISSMIKGVNNYHPESEYLNVVKIPEKWPFSHSTIPKIKIISINGFDNIEDFIQKSENKGLTHIVVTNKTEQKFLKNIFTNENELPYLTKIYDSKDENYEYSLKVFKVNYEKFNCITKELCS